ncbi:hypothetical protein M0802_009035 [Mischocyttarus mexicanus]|nr:hypothetical protein M0802_009035 [Mischocyttarus mexicanus]
MLGILEFSFCAYSIVKHEEWEEKGLGKREEDPKGTYFTGANFGARVNQRLVVPLQQEQHLILEAERP